MALEYLFGRKTIHFTFKCVPHVNMICTLSLKKFRPTLGLSEKQTNFFRISAIIFV